MLSAETDSLHTPSTQLRLSYDSAGLSGERVCLAMALGLVQALGAKALTPSPSSEPFHTVQSVLVSVPAREERARRPYTFSRVRAARPDQRSA